MTEFIFKYLRSITFSLAILMLCQCCRVYYKEPVSVNEAMNNKLKKVKIITIDDRELKFDSIYYIESSYIKGLL